MKNAFWAIFLLAATVAAYAQQEPNGTGISSLDKITVVDPAHNTETTIGPTPTGQPGTTVETKKVGPTAGQEAAAGAAAAGVMIGSLIGVQQGSKALMGAIVKHQGEDKNYKDAKKHCMQRYMAKAGYFGMGEAVREHMDECKAYAAHEFPDAPEAKK